MRISHVRRRFGVGAVLLAVTVAGGTAVVAPSASGAGGFVLNRTLDDSRIVESSGLARSTYRRGTLFTHNDSGDRARVFAVSPSGRTQAVLTLGGVKPKDDEDIAAG